MLTATYISGPLGALPTIPRPKHGGYQKKYMAPLLDGKRIIVGPFNFSAEKNSHWKLTQAQFDHSVLRDQHDWVLNQLVETSWRYRDQCKRAKFLPVPLNTMMACEPCWKTWCLGTYKNGNPVLVPRQVWLGKAPFVRTKDPETGQEWGLYAHFDNTGDPSQQGGRVINFAFKKIEPSWLASALGAIWDFIVAVVSFVVDTVSALFEFLKTLGCSLARNHMDDLAALAAGAVGIPPGMVETFGKLGVSQSDLEKVKDGATSTLVQNIGNKVADAICGKADVKYPMGSVTAQDAGQWRVAAPQGATTAQASTSSKYVESAVVNSKPVVPRKVTLEEYKRLLKGPWYTRPSTWAMFGAGALAVGGGTYYRTRKPAT